MKKLICLISLISLIWTRPVLAADATKSAAQDLLDRVATRVADLTGKLRRVYTGKVKSVGTTSYVIATSDGDRTVTTNDVTSFYRIRAGNKTEVNFGSLKVGDDIAAIGTIDPNTFEMTAKQIIAKIRRYNLVGTVSETNKTIYSLNEIGGPKTSVDFEDAVSLKTMNLQGQVTATKVSAFKVGDLVFAIAYFSDPKSDTLSILKALRFEK